MYDKPLPVSDPGTETFWSEARAARLTIPRCLDCGRHHFYPRALCPHCHSDRLEWSQVSGRGTIHSYTIVRRAPGPAFAADVPYAVVLIDLAEGPRMLSNLVGAKVDTIRIGDTVEVVFDAVTDEVTLPSFRPVAAA
jgi:uncharacterized OB-fold protein